MCIIILEKNHVLFIHVENNEKRETFHFAK